MEKAEILRWHENYIQNTYYDMRELRKQNEEIENTILLLSKKLKEDHDFDSFYHEFALLQQEKFMNLIELKDLEVELSISRARIFFELGMISKEERTQQFQKAEELYDWEKEIYNVEYQAVLLKLASIQDMESERYEQLVRHIYSVKQYGALIKHYTKSKWEK